MTMRFLVPIAALAILAGNSEAQTYRRTATIRGGGNGSGGKCTLEVVVDGAVQVEIGGEYANLVNLHGQPPQWRRFECTSPMPANPQGFRFAGVDGRGTQRLVREPGNGSPAVIEIDDPASGSEGYTFDVTWTSGSYSQGNYRQQGYPQQNYPQQNYPQQNLPQQGYPQRRYNNGNSVSVDDAVQICEDNVRQLASNRYRTNDVQFRESTVDDNSGRGDSVIGTVDVRIPRQADQLMKFSCSVDFSNGRVRNADLQPVYSERDNRGGGRSALSTQNCQRAVQQRVGDQGYSEITFGQLRADEQNGQRVTGDLRAYGRYGSQAFRFSCDVDPRNGEVRSIDVSRGNEW